jgi:hypothetical protein
MPKPKPRSTFAEVMVRAHYGRHSLQWIGDRLGCSPATVLNCAEQLGLWTPNISERGDTTAVPAVVCSDATEPFISPPTREQLMAGSANLRRVYKTRRQNLDSDRPRRLLVDDQVELGW